MSNISTNQHNKYFNKYLVFDNSISESYTKSPRLLKCIGAPQPNDILWDNLKIKPSHRYIRYILLGMW